MDGIGGAYRNALSAQGALVEIDVSQIVDHCNSLKLTLLHALAAADTGHFTVFTCNPALFLVDTGYKNPAVFLPFLAHLDDVSRAGLHTSPAGHALIVKDHWQAGHRVHIHGIELAGLHTVAAAQATVWAAPLA